MSRPPALDGSPLFSSGLPTSSMISITACRVLPGSGRIQLMVAALLSCSY
jgi:hypothetical protein